MAEVRSVEQQYWSLAQAHVQLRTADRAVGMAETSIASRLTCWQAVAPWPMSPRPRRDSSSSTSTRSRGPRTSSRPSDNCGSLGLPPCDNRTIVPVTPATDTLVEFDWDSCLHEMMDNQPDIAQQKLLVRVAELQLLIARNQLLPPLSLNALYQLNGLGKQPDSPFATMTGEKPWPRSGPGDEDMQGAVPGRDSRQGSRFRRLADRLHTPDAPGITRGPLANSRQVNMTSFDRGPI